MCNLNEIHPELFFTLPRRGGSNLVKIPNTPQHSSLRSKIKSNKHTADLTLSQESLENSGHSTKNSQVSSSMDTSPWILFNDSFHKNNLKKKNLAQNSIDILAVTIGSIMLLASGHKKIAETNLRLTKSYLEHIRDEFGDNPPNLKSILNQLQLVYPNLDSHNKTQ